MKIICIGRNYKDHAKELNNSIPKNPVFFCKPDTALNRASYYFLPSYSNEIHYELELVVKINKVGKTIQKKFAHKYYNEITIGLDLTARDLQNSCKENGLPWEISKGFDGSAPIGIWFKKETLSSFDFHLLKNGEKVQNGNPKDMLFDIDTIIEYVSRYMTLKKGDLIYTGTPAGVGKMNINDKFEGYLDGKKALTLSVK